MDVILLEQEAARAEEKLTTMLEECMTLFEAVSYHLFLSHSTHKSGPALIAQSAVYQTGDQEVTVSILVVKYFLLSFCSFC